MNFSILVLVTGHVWVLPPAAPDYADFWDIPIPDPEAELESGQ
jgi:hypothetical protein